MSRGADTFLEFKSAGKLPLAKWAKYIWRWGILCTIDLAKRCILIVKLRGAVDLCTLCGERLLAEHIESKKRTINSFSVEFDTWGIAVMYSSAEVIALRDPINSWIGMLKLPVGRSFLTNVEFLIVKFNEQ